MEEAIVIAGFWNCSNGKIHSDLFKQWKVVSETEWFLNLLLGFKVPIKIKNWDVETYRNNLEDVFDRIKSTHCLFILRRQLHNPHFFQRCFSFLLKSNQSPFLSKMLPNSLFGNIFERNEDYSTVFLKWTDFIWDNNHDIAYL